MLGDISRQKLGDSIFSMKEFKYTIIYPWDYYKWQLSFVQRMSKIKQCNYKVLAGFIIKFYSPQVSKNVVWVNATDLEMLVETLSRGISIWFHITTVLTNTCLLCSWIFMNNMVFNSTVFSWHSSSSRCSIKYGLELRIK